VRPVDGGAASRSWERKRGRWLLPRITYRGKDWELTLPSSDEANEGIVPPKAWPVEVMTELGQGRFPANTLVANGAGNLGPVGGGYQGIQVSEISGLIVKDAEAARALALELMRAAARIDDQVGRHARHGGGD
jgi:hypothetical protein